MARQGRSKVVVVDNSSLWDKASGVENAQCSKPRHGGTLTLEIQLHPI